MVSYSLSRERRKLINSNRDFKLLDIGWGLGQAVDLGSVEVDEEDFSSANSFYDYDAIFIDPAEVSSLWTDYLRPGADGSFKSNPREDGGLTRGVQNLMRARREEIEELLDKNRAVFCKLRNPGKDLTVVKNGENKNLGSYSWLPIGEDLFSPGRESIKKRQGDRLEITRKDLQLGTFLDSYGDLVSYSAVLDKNIKATDTATEVIARTPSGELAAFTLKANGGRVYFLPAEMDLDKSARGDFLEVAGNLFGSQLYQELDWLDDYGMEEEKANRSEFEEIKEEISRLKRKMEEKREELKTVSNFKRLLAAGSEFELKTVLQRVLKELGFETEQSDSGIDMLVSLPEGERFALKAGVNRDGPIGLEPYHELVRGINDLKIYENDDPQGVLVVNGYSSSDPAERPEQVKDELLSGCNLYGFTVVTSAELFEIVKEKGTREERAAAVEGLFNQG